MKDRHAREAIEALAKSVGYKVNFFYTISPFVDKIPNWSGTKFWDDKVSRIRALENLLGVKWVTADNSLPKYIDVKIKNERKKK